MKTKILIFLLWLLVFLPLISACARDEVGEAPEQTATAPPAASETATADETATVVSATPTSTPTPTPTATPTPLSPAVTAIEQAVDEEGEVVVSEVTVPEAGWVVVYDDDGGEPGRVLGSTAVGPGNSRDVPVDIDPYLATSTLHVRLHRDAGETGAFEYPGVDEPLPDGEPVTVAFPVDIQVIAPGLAVADQEVGREQGQVVVDRVTAPGPGWVALHADIDGTPGTRLGQAPVREGENENVVINFDWRRATRPLHVVLYEDAGEPGRFEPGEADRQILVGGTPAMASFVATLPVDVFVINQPAGGGEVYVERALINEPGWLAVYTDFAGLADRLLGYVPLEPGATESLVVPIDESGITPLLHIMLHEDLGTVGEFEYPGPDLPIRREGRMQLFSFQTDAGSYLETEDQLLAGDRVIIPLVVADPGLWLAIHATDEGEVGEIIGQRSLGPGVHRGVTVTVDADAATPLLYAALYLDAEPVGEFEPEGSDVPFRFGSNLIRAPFSVEIED